MKVQIEGLVKIISRQYKGIYTNEQIKEIVERDGANSLNANINYCGFGVWEVKEG